MFSLFNNCGHKKLAQYEKQINSLFFIEKSHKHYNIPTTLQ
ncbi:hypothetical protein ECDEC15A_4371 [Escherichia coli DEC15A]|nr:hypothetical protein ECDEC15A_4371 [Escherichia coli DEC15A]EHY02441.1 hypothetical protein ECDEC15C_4558 [Escherichia coli DEC15C]EHY10274.1 hypothetical protein ECDEC15D_4505 [Escherichia coli DEC15D]EHY14913.1 hypothetical protein ECDEC15E_4857 [Escherichia coli DEC15E]